MNGKMNDKRQFMKWILALLKVIVALLAVGGVLVAGVIGFAMWSMYKGITGENLVKARTPQAKLCLEIRSVTGVELPDSVVVKNAFRIGFLQGYSSWWEVSFDAKENEKIKAMFLEKGYKVETEERRKVYFEYRLPDVPKKIVKWWNSNRLEKTTLFSVRRRDSQPGCFLDDKQGILFIVDYVP